MIILLFVFLNLEGITGLPGQGSDPFARLFTIEGKEVRTTYKSDDRFYGKYSGSKGGYLLLNSDGTGEYLDDYFAFALAGCPVGPVIFRWGFILDEKDQVVRFERDYGYSIPVIYESTGEKSFQGCRKKVFVDYLLIRVDGTIEVSSSDDWKKTP
jgi:hypothetical protein